MKPHHSLRGIAALLAVLGFALGDSAPAQHAVSLTQQQPRSITGVRFRFVADGAVRGGFALSGSRLLFGTEAGSLYAIDARDGRPLWRERMGSPVASTPTLIGGRAFLTSDDNILHAIDAASGKEFWKADLGRTIGPNTYWEYYTSSPIAADGRLYVGSASGRVFAIDAARGKLVWSTDLGARVRTTPLVVPGKVIVGTMSGHVVALDRSTGRELWRFASVGASQDFSFKHNDTRSIVTRPILVGQTVIAGGRDGNIYGVDANTGKELWHETHDGGSWILGLAGDPATFYSGSGSAFIMQAADARTGKELWRVPTGSALFGDIAKAGTVLVTNSSAGFLLGIDTGGKELWRFRLPDLSFASPLVADNTAYTGADDGSVYAISTDAAGAPLLDRYVYTFTAQPDAGFFWFKPEVVAALNGEFAASGYAAIGTKELGDLLAAPIGANGRKIVVIADTRLPNGVDAATVRRFLDGGGILALTGLNPLAFSFAPEGQPNGQDEEAGAKAFDMTAADIERDNGYNMSRYTAAARLLGLSGSFVANRWASPSEVSVPLAVDQSGNATAWIKRFANGGLLINLPVGRNRPTDLTSTINAVNLIASRTGAGAF